MGAAMRPTCTVERVHKVLCVARPKGLFLGSRRLLSRPSRTARLASRPQTNSLLTMSSTAEPAAKRAKTEEGQSSIFSRHAVCCVLDYGSQYTQLIARRVRDAGVLSVLLPGDVTMVSILGSANGAQCHWTGR
jgi:hypothetical protein